MCICSRRVHSFTGQRESGLASETFLSNTNKASPNMIHGSDRIQLAHTHAHQQKHQTGCNITGRQSRKTRGQTSVLFSHLFYTTERASRHRSSRCLTRSFQPWGKCKATSRHQSNQSMTNAHSEQNGTSLSDPPVRYLEYGVHHGLNPTIQKVSLTKPSHAILTSPKPSRCIRKNIVRQITNQTGPTKSPIPIRTSILIRSPFLSSDWQVRWRKSVPSILI
jgi:hypothetical protein